MSSISCKPALNPYDCLTIKTPLFIGQACQTTLLVLGILALTGTVVPHLSIITASLSGGGGLMSLIGLRNYHKSFFSIQLATTIMGVVCGILGITGALSAVQVGWSIIGLQLATFQLSCCAGCSVNISAVLNFQEVLKSNSQD